MCVFQGSKWDVITVCFFVPVQDSLNTLVLQMKLNRKERLKLGDKKRALLHICLKQGKKIYAGFAIASFALDAGWLKSFQSIFMVIKKSSKSSLLTNKVLTVLYIFKHSVRNEWKSVCYIVNLHPTPPSPHTHTKKKDSQVLCKMQTQCPKNNSYLTAVIIIGNTSENSSPSCV